MSKNFELMQQIGRDFGATSVPRPSQEYSKVHEKVRTNGTRLDLGQVAREECLNWLLTL